MRLTVFSIVSIVSALLLGGCAAPIPVGGESRADDTLKSDITKMLVLRARVSFPCDHVDAIHAEVVKINPVGTGRTLASRKYGSIDERWVVSLCAKDIAYRVTLTPDGEGGTFFLVGPDK